MALEIVSLVSRNKECVSEIAACEILGHFLVALRDTELKEMQDRVLETLSGLLNVQKMVKEAQSKGNKQTTNFKSVRSFIRPINIQVPLYIYWMPSLTRAILNCVNNVLNCWPK